MCVCPTFTLTATGDVITSDVKTNSFEILKKLEKLSLSNATLEYRMQSTKLGIYSQ